MRKEGMARTRAALSAPLIPRPSRRLVSGLASRPIEGPSSKVSTKPKYTTGESNRHNFVKLLKTGENMKRSEDGRQRGVVRTSPLMPRPHRGLVSELASRPTGVLFSKVSAKPTGKRNGSHIRPACRSKPKVKGAHNKVKSLSDIRLVSWRVVDAPCSKLSGSSSTRVLDYLDGRW